MARVCPHCGAANPGTSLWCAFCRAPLKPEKSDSYRAPVASRAVARAVTSETAPATANEPIILGQAVPSSEPMWRMELNRKIEAYRVRTGRQVAPNPQAHLPFSPQVVAAAATPAKPAPPQSARPVERPGRERMQIYVDQGDLDFRAANPSPNHALVPVAGLQRRALAWIIDIGFLVACWAMFVGLLEGLGVKLADNRIAVAICAVIFFLLYAQYFGLFSAFGGTTPGMRVAGLRVVSFDGNVPTPKQLLWRSFGYLLAGGAVLLGFLWAMWDEDRLCWQDRTSQTYLTSLPDLSEHNRFEERR